MRGNELLDKLERIDPAYIEAADTAPNKRKRVWAKWGTAAAWFVSGRSKDEGLNKARFDRGTLIASGFIAGGALMGVVSAVLKFVGVDWFLSGWASSNAAEWTGLAMYLVLIGYFAWHTLRAKKEE